MSGKKVFVGNLAYETTDDQLKIAFEIAGTVVEAKIVRRGNRSKGFGFVEFSSEDEAQKAVELMDKKDLNERPINVQVSTSTGTKVGNEDNNNNRSERSGGYNNYRDNYNYRDNNRDNNYNDNYNDNYDNNYRDNYRDNYRENNYRDNRGPRRFNGGRRGNYNNNNSGNGQRRVYHLKDRYDDYNPRRGNGGYNRGPRRNYDNNNNNRPRNNNNNRSQSNVEKVESQTTIFVANLPYDVDDEQLITLFGKCGAIKTAHVVKNRGKSKGYGFVEFEDNDGQKKALAEMDNHQIVYKNGEDRNLSVKVAMSAGDNEENDKNEGDNENENENDEE